MTEKEHSFEEQWAIIRDPVNFAFSHYSQVQLRVLYEVDPFLYRKLARKGLLEEISSRVEISAKKRPKRRTSPSPRNLLTRYYDEFKGWTPEEIREEHPIFYHHLLSAGLMSRIKDYIKEQEAKFLDA